ncbi:MAG: hypothetical protein NZM29_06110 [Nitrospira sp.]|nr:hypothetical protein [Nitrospira sp.]
MKRKDVSCSSDKEPVRMSIESIIVLGVLGWLTLGMIFMGLGIW